MNFTEVFALHILNYLEFLYTFMQGVKNIYALSFKVDQAATK